MEIRKSFSFLFEPFRVLGSKCFSILLLVENFVLKTPFNKLCWHIFPIDSFFLTFVSLRYPVNRLQTPFLCLCLLFFSSCFFCYEGIEVKDFIKREHWLDFHFLTHTSHHSIHFLQPCLLESDEFGLLSHVCSHFFVFLPLIFDLFPEEVGVIHLVFQQTNFFCH
ncbi:hypothetical protein HanRHA438_Chr16g0746471 [Helianthus annuus]|nr:hypothetical protein HanRHA438_Chr16g0746471 [Helianthus annuus]